MTGVTQLVYEMACREPEFQQEFLDALGMGEYAPFVSRVIWKDHKKPKFTMRTDPHFRCSPRNPGYRSKISVHSSSFSLVPALVDFQGLLWHHEGLHAKENFETPELSQYPCEGWERVLRDLEGELRMWTNQELNFVDGENSDVYRRMIEVNLRKYRTSIDIARQKLGERKGSRRRFLFFKRV